jgi:hypothetical protein
MASDIDVTKPTAGSATTESVRQNFAYAKTEIEALQVQTALAASQLIGDEPIPQEIIGDPGTEANSVNIAGTAYECIAKISDIGSAFPPMELLHRHSTTLQPLSLSARSNSNTTAHANVVAGMGLYSQFHAGYSGSNYKVFASMDWGVKAGATPSETSAPGRFSIALTKTNEIWPTPIFYGDEDGITSAIPIAVPSGGSGSEVVTSDEIDSRISAATSAQIQSATTQATTSGTYKDFISVPAWAKEITVNLTNVISSPYSPLLILLGSSGVPKTSDYSTSTSYITASNSNVINLTNGFRGWGIGNSATGSITFTLIDPSTNTWVGKGMFQAIGAIYLEFWVGEVSLAGILDIIRLTTLSGTANFYSGKINALYKG